MKNFLVFIFTLVVFISLTGCANGNRAYERSSLDIDWTFTPDVKDNINQSINDMADQLLKHSRITIKDNIAITAFVDLHKLNKTTHFGRKVSESFFNELHVRGLSVVDVRGTQNIRINADGEFFITRDIKLLHDKVVENSYILIGTYSKFGKGILLNARIVDNISGVVVATARSIIDIDACDIYENCKTMQTVVPKEKVETKVTKRTIGLSDAGCSYVNCPSNCVDSACYKNVIKKQQFIPEPKKEQKKPEKTCCVKTIPSTLFQR